MKSCDSTVVEHSTHKLKSVGLNQTTGKTDKIANRNMTIISSTLVEHLTHHSKVIRFETLASFKLALNFT